MSSTRWSSRDSEPALVASHQETFPRIMQTSKMGLGPFEIHSLLGCGGMGQVYRARDTRRDRTVAIKVIPRHHSCDSLGRHRFEHEARAVSALRHPNICALYDTGQQNGIDYLVMEYLEGETLAFRLAKGSLPLEHVLVYGIEVAGALDAAHLHGVVHRDVKPGNIFLTTHRECKVLDWQSWRRNQRDAHADIFSLGKVLYEMVTGKSPFSGQTEELAFQASLDERLAPPSDAVATLPKQFDQIIGRALEQNRELRYSSAAELRADLERLKLEIENGRGAARYG